MTNRVSYMPARGGDVMKTAMIFFSTILAICVAHADSPTDYLEHDVALLHLLHYDYFELLFAAILPVEPKRLF